MFWIVADTRRGNVNGDARVVVLSGLSGENRNIRGASLVSEDGTAVL